MFKKNYPVFLTITLLILASFHLSACKTNSVDSKDYIHTKETTKNDTKTAINTNTKGKSKSVLLAKGNANTNSIYIAKQKSSNINVNNNSNVKNLKITAKIKTKLIKNKNTKKLWTRLSNTLNWKYHKDQKLVNYYINKYKKQPYHIQTLSKNATPYLYHVVSELEKQNLPGELAVIPMIESGYKPEAISKVGASGLWQLTKTTAKRYGIKQDKWYDGRRDLIDSTAAALKYLNFLHKEFNNDWLLALAAYNAGEGRVRRAIKKNTKLKKSTSFWDLPLPKQTRHFVPKILAMAHILKNPENLHTNFKHIKNQPHFAEVNTKSHMTLETAAKLAEISVKELKKINPGYLKHSTHPNQPRKLFVPIDKVNTFKLNVAKARKSTFDKTVMHKVKSGDTLLRLAKKYKTTVTSIRLINNLKNNIIVSGKDLVIPLNSVYF